jgi:hypothetical protein
MTARQYCAAPSWLSDICLLVHSIAFGRVYGERSVITQVLHYRGRPARSNADSVGWAHRYVVVLPSLPTTAISARTKVEPIAIPEVPISSSGQWHLGPHCLWGWLLWVLCGPSPTTLVLLRPRLTGPDRGTGTGPDRTDL